MSGKVGAGGEGIFGTNRVVLLPGLHGSAALFAPFIAAAPTWARPQAAAYPPDGPYDYDAAEVTARAVLPDDRPFVLVAESFSGPVALRIAADPPQGLRAVVLVASFARSPLPVSLGRVPDAAFSLLPMRSAIPRWFLGGSRREAGFDRLLRETLHGVSRDTFVARLRAIDEVDVRHLLPDIRLPVVYLQATADRLIAPAFGRELIACAATGRLARVRGAHMLLQTAPEACWRAVLTG